MGGGAPSQTPCHTQASRSCRKQTPSRNPCLHSMNTLFPRLQRTPVRISCGNGKIQYRRPSKHCSTQIVVARPRHAQIQANTVVLSGLGCLWRGVVGQVHGGECAPSRQAVAVAVDAALATSFRYVDASENESATASVRQPQPATADDTADACASAVASAHASAVAVTDTHAYASVNEKHFSCTLAMVCSMVTSDYVQLKPWTVRTRNIRATTRT